MNVTVFFQLDFAKRCPETVKVININNEDIVFNTIFYGTEEEIIERYREYDRALPPAGFFACDYDMLRKARKLTDEERAILFK